MADHHGPVGILSGRFPGIEREEHRDNTFFGDEGIKKSTLGKVNLHPYTINLLFMVNIKTNGWVQPKEVDGCPSPGRLNVLDNHGTRNVPVYPFEMELSPPVRVGQLTREDASPKIVDQLSEPWAGGMAEPGITETILE